MQMPPLPLLPCFNKYDFQSLCDLLRKLSDIRPVFLRHKNLLNMGHLGCQDFSFKPPIGSTRPLKVISPVMATFARTFFPVTADSMAVAMVMPADGPSFGTAPLRDMDMQVMLFKIIVCQPVFRADENAHR